ncbi:MAG: hypothetical protein HZB50_14385 [Chloroflexi bacterium]|nr:hypothetical protein [Chloroflexota bacterium]
MGHKQSTLTFCMLILALLTLSACDGVTLTPSTTGQEMLLATPALMIVSCEACDQATLAAALTQQKSSADSQAAATAEIARANAQATVDSANATLDAAMTQAQNNTNIIVAQIAATAEVARANAQATLVSAGSTQGAAQTQDALRQTQVQYDLQVTQAVGTQGALAIITQQSKNDLASGTQTAVAENIATQTQAAAATSQWYTDQSRQRDEQRQGPIAFFWMWCFPVFVLLFAILVLWGIWRWQKLQQARQRALENPVDKFQTPAVEIIHHYDSLPHLESDVNDNAYQLTTPEDEVGQWLDEVKTKLLDHDKKEEDDSTDN